MIPGNAFTFRAFLLASPLAAMTVTVIACSSEPSDDGGRTPRPSDAGTSEQRDVGPVDPNNGRDDKPESCFAACQNTAFTCLTKGASTTSKADLQLTQAGCEGTLTDDGVALAMKIECLRAEVCLGAAAGQAASECVKGTFSAFAFAYTPGSGGAQNVCTRD